MEAGQGKDLHLGMLFLDSLGRLHAIHAGHEHIHEHHVRLGLAAQLQGFLAATCLPHQFQVVERA
jgi:hypothetical protein